MIFGDIRSTLGLGNDGDFGTKEGSGKTRLTFLFLLILHPAVEFPVDPTTKLNFQARKYWGKLHLF